MRISATNLFLPLLFSLLCSCEYCEGKPEDNRLLLGKGIQEQVEASYSTSERGLSIKEMRRSWGGYMCRIYQKEYFQNFSKKRGFDCRKFVLRFNESEEFFYLTSNPSAKEFTRFKYVFIDYLNSTNLKEIERCVAALENLPDIEEDIKIRKNILRRIKNLSRNWSYYLN